MILGPLLLVVPETRIVDHPDSTRTGIMSYPEWIDACQTGDLATVQDQFLHFPTDQRHQGLWEAAANGRLEVVRCLVGASHRPQSEVRGVFQVACENGHLAIVQYLVQVGCATKTAQLGLRSAVYQGHLEVVRYLIEQGVTEDALTLYSLAACRGQLEIIRYLMGAGIPWREVGGDALTAACGHRHREVAVYLVELGVDHRQDRESPFRLACRVGDLMLIQYLLDRGVSEETVLRCHRKHPDCRELLDSYIHSRRLKSAYMAI